MMTKNKLDLSNLTGRNVNVAIIDSGIDSDHPQIGPIAGGTQLSLDGRIITGGDFTDCAGHGTACAGIIRKKAPQADLFSIRIFDASLGTDGRLLIAALQWAVEQQIDVVNLSLGTTDVALRDELQNACRQAVNAGLILVAAEHNEGRESYPAVFSEVIGVTAGKVRGTYGYYYRPGAMIECVARGDEQRLCWTNPRYVMTGGTSYAAPHITGIVALIRQAHPNASLQQVREMLQAHALKGNPERLRETENSPQALSLPIVASAISAKPTVVTDTADAIAIAAAKSPDATTAATTTAAVQCTAPTASVDLDQIGKAALYPFNKEMHGFVRYFDQLDFAITGIADPVGKGLVGKDAGEAIGLPPVGVRIAPRLQDALKGADTLILGYVDQLGRIAKRDVLRESIQTALEAGVHVFSFLQVPPSQYGDLYEQAHQKGLRISYPYIALGQVQDALRHASQYGPVDAPVLGVFGTSAQQGKFTVQLALRKKLLQRGYTLGQLGTEHQSELFGMDFAFPIGYASSVDLPVQYYAPFIDAKLRQINHEKAPDIILVGAQSGTIPYDLEEHGSHALPALAFLLGAKPDACILVVNSIDPDEYIRDTIDTIRTLAKAPTLLLAMSDKEKHIRAAYGRTFIKPRPMSREEIDAKLRALEESFGVPAIEIVSSKGQERMVDTVVQYFSAEKGAGAEPEETIERSAIPAGGEIAEREKVTREVSPCRKAQA